MDLSGAAFVIGASGIGKACALAFAKNGACGIVVADIDLDAANVLAAECNLQFQEQHRSTVGGSGIVAPFAHAVSIDVTDSASVACATEYAAQKLGRMDYCVNAAGIGVQKAGEVAEADRDEFDLMLRVNVIGSFLVARTASALMKTQDPAPAKKGCAERGTTRGSIVMVGSASAYVATPGMVQYTTAKHAVLGLTKNAALDNAAYGIRVNSVCPSWVDTPMVRRALDDVPGLSDMIRSSVPIGRIAHVDEVADAVMFLCSPLASYATGCNLILDGGTTLSANA